MTDDRFAKLCLAIDDDPYDARAYAVLGDHLQELGDPRGELIALQLGRRDATHELAAAEIIARLGQPPGVTFQYANGYARAATIEPGTAKGTRDALAHPSARFLVELRVLHNNAPLTGTINAITAAPRPTLRILQLGKRLHGGLYQAEERELGDLSALWAAAPRLEDLELLGCKATFGRIEAPHLRSFAWHTSVLTTEAATALATARLPALQRLTLGCAVATRAASPRTMRALAPLLARDDLPALTHLRLEDLTGADALLEVLAASPVLRHLTSVELVRTDLTDAGAETILARQAAFAQLATFNLHYHQLTDERARQLRACLPAAGVAPSSEADDDEYYDDADE